MSGSGLFCDEPCYDIKLYSARVIAGYNPGYFSRSRLINRSQPYEGKANPAAALINLNCDHPALADTHADCTLISTHKA